MSFGLSMARRGKQHEVLLIIFIVSFDSYIILINRFHFCVHNILMNKTKPHLLYKFFV
jgi:hypothetical protein